MWSMSEHTAWDHVRNWESALDLRDFTNPWMTIPLQIGMLVGTSKFPYLQYLRIITYSMLCHHATFTSRHKQENHGEPISTRRRGTIEIVATPGSWPSWPISNDGPIIPHDVVVKGYLTIDQSLGVRTAERWWKMQVFVGISQNITKPGCISCVSICFVVLIALYLLYPSLTFFDLLPAGIWRLQLSHWVTLCTATHSKIKFVTWRQSTTWRGPSGRGLAIDAMLTGFSTVVSRGTPQTTCGLWFNKKETHGYIGQPWSVLIERCL